MRLGFAAGEEVVPLARVDRIWVKDGNRKGAGIVAGLVLFVPTFTLLEAGACTDGGSDSADCVSKGLLIGAASGIVLGGLVGSALPRWRLLYPARGAR